MDTQLMVVAGGADRLDRPVMGALLENLPSVDAFLPARGVLSGQALLGPNENGRYPPIRASTAAQAMARGAV